MSMATLGFNIDSSKALDAKANLEKMTGASKAAEKASEALSTASTRAAGGGKAMAQASEMVAKAQASVTAATKASTAALNAQAAASKSAAYQSRMLAIQAGDVVQSLALGMPVQQVLLQQGFQIQSLYGGIGATFKGVGRAATGAAGSLGRLAVANPVITAGLGAMSIGLVNVTRELHAAGYESIGFADTAKAAWQVAADGIRKSLQPAISAIAPWVGTAWDLVSRKTHWLANTVINSFRAVGSDIKFIFSNIPKIVEAAAIGAANGVIKGVNWAIQKAAEGLDWFINRVNSRLPDRLKMGTIGTVSPLTPIKGEAPDDLAKANTEHRKVIEQIMNSDPLGQFGKAIMEKAISNAAEATKKLGAAAGTAKDAWEGLRKVTGDTVTKMRDRINDLGQSIGGIFRGLTDQTMSWKDAAMQAIQSVLTFLNQRNIDKGGSGLFGGGLVQSLLGGFLGVSLPSGTFPSAPSATGGLWANGGAFSNGNVIPFASGGVVTRPTLFPMANGSGLMGEAGPEAIMPLRRTSDGRLGVVAANSNARGAANQNIHINVTVNGARGNAEIEEMVHSGVAKGIAAAAPALVDGGANQAMHKLARGEADSTMSALYGVQRQTKVIG